MYSLDSDSINFSGGNSVNSNFDLDSTIGEISSGTSSSALYALSTAGFLQQDSSTISLSLSENNVTMSPSLGGLTGGYSNGSVSLNVVTDSTSGYTLFVQTEGSPALQSVDDSFANYSPSGSNPDYDYSVVAGQSNFGFSVEGGDINSRFKDNGSVCSAGSYDTSGKCWDGFSTSVKVIAGSNASNGPTGTETVLKFRAGVGAGKAQKQGDYYATTTITAVAN
ncbi:MAG: hypothetical protein WCO84_05805 [bacterium]